MESKLLIGMGFIVFASLTTQLSGIIFRHYPKMTGGELAEQYPELAWMPVAYPVLSVLWFLIFGFAPIYLMINSELGFMIPFQASIYILGGAIGSTSILQGLFGLISKICPLPHKRNRLYVFDEDMRTPALLLMVAGVFMIIVALAMIYFYVLWH